MFVKLYALPTKVTKSHYFLIINYYSSSYFEQINVEENNRKSNHENFRNMISFSQLMMDISIILFQGRRNSTIKSNPRMEGEFG